MDDVFGVTAVLLMVAIVGFIAAFFFWVLVALAVLVALFFLWAMFTEEVDYDR